MLLFFASEYVIVASNHRNATVSKIRYTQFCMTQNGKTGRTGTNNALKKKKKKREAHQ
jgi:hypothetical protein